MPDVPGDSSSPNEKVDVVRRAFLKLTLTGGAGMALTSAATASGHSNDEASCEVTSAGESLLIYLGMVNLLLTEAFSSIHRRTVERLRSCERVYAELYEAVDDLCQYLGSHPQASSQAQQLRDLVKVGQANTQLAQAHLSSSPREEKLGLASLAFVTQQVCIQAQNLFPPGSKARLDETATDKLRNILDKINQPEFKRLYTASMLGPHQPRQVDPKKDEVTVANELINNRLLKFIGAARTAIVEAENPTPVDENLRPRIVDRAAQWQAADQNLRDALETLKTLVSPMELVTADGEPVTRALVSTKLPQEFINGLPDNVLSQNPLRSVPNTDPDFTPADGLILTLGGTRRLIKKPAYRRTAFADGGRADNPEARYIAAAYPTGPPAAPRRLDDISRLLWWYCPPGYISNAQKCQAVVLFANGWDTTIWEFVRVGAIRVALYGAERFGQISCSGNRDFGSLARALARL